MAVLNVTPDSFSDGGRFAGPQDAIAAGLAQVAAGADLVDVGGESTRPGSTRVSAAEEQARVLEVVAGLADAGVRVSVDTLHAATAAAAIRAGASLINDVSGGLADPEMLAAVAEGGAEYAIGHWRGIPDPQHSRAQYGDVLADVTAELAERVAAARAAGIAEERLIVDPGLGFDKTTEQGWRLLAGFPDLGRTLGLPVLIGVSRKRMLAELLPAGHAVTERDLPTAVVSALAARSGAWGVRVHDVAGTRTALAVQSAWDADPATPPPGTEPR